MMPQANIQRPPIGGWRGLNPDVVTQVAQLMAAARNINADTPTGRRLIAAWRSVDDPTAYSRAVAELAPAEIDYEQAFRSLLSDREDDR
jgi:hypothetical protein